MNKPWLIVVIALAVATVSSAVLLIAANNSNADPNTRYSIEVWSCNGGTRPQISQYWVHDYHAIPHWRRFVEQMDASPQASYAQLMHGAGNVLDEKSWSCLGN